MNIHYTHQNHLVHLTDQQALAVLQMRRRRLLGMLLIVMGSVWFGLRLFGFVGDMCMPMSWQEGISLISPVVFRQRSNPELLTAYGMLTTKIIYPLR